MAIAIGTLPSACTHNLPSPGKGVFTVKTTYNPVGHTDKGTIRIVHWEMSGTPDYQWVIVPNEESKLYTQDLLQALEGITKSQLAGVMTTAEYLADLRGDEEESDRTKEINADMIRHAAVIHSYENRPKK